MPMHALTIFQAVTRLNFVARPGKEELPKANKTTLPDVNIVAMDVDTSYISQAPVKYRD